MWFLYSKFKAKKWLKYSYEKRFKIFVELEKRVAKQLHIEPIKLEINYEDWNCFGAFSVDALNKRIVINSNLLEQPKYRFHGMETIAHETRHAYQFSVISRKLKWYEFTAKKWRDNWAGYFSSSVDNVMYNNQAVERDAQKYSIKFLRKHKYTGDPDYERTINIVVGRYEQADEDARKKYGIFYKYKINKNVRKNSKY